MIKIKKINMKGGNDLGKYAIIYSDDTLLVAKDMKKLISSSETFTKSNKLEINGLLYIIFRSLNSSQLQQWCGT